MRQPTGLRPMMVAAYIEHMASEPQTVRQARPRFAMLYDWLVIGQIVPTNPAGSVRGPGTQSRRARRRCCREPTRALLVSIDAGQVVCLRDRALIGLMTYSFARVGAVVGMSVSDYYQNGKKWWIRLHGKGGKFHEMPVHHSAEEYLGAYPDAAGIRDQPKAPLFRTTQGLSRFLTSNGLQPREALTMIKRRAKDAGLSATVCNHTFRATGITAYLANGGTVENAQAVAAHESPRTTKLYDQRSDQISLDEIERIII